MMHAFEAGSCQAVENSIQQNIRDLLERNTLNFDEFLLPKSIEFRKLQIQAADLPIFKASRVWKADFRPGSAAEARFRTIPGTFGGRAPPAPVRRTRRAGFPA